MEMIRSLPNIDRRTYTSALRIFLVLVLATAVLAIAPIHGAPVKSIEKALSPVNGGLGTVVSVTLTISGTEAGETVLVSDNLKGTGLSYIPLSASISPTSTKKGLITFDLSADAVITFDVKVTEAHAWEDTDIVNTATAVWTLVDGTTVEYSSSADFTILKFDSLDKYISVDGEKLYDVTATLGVNEQWMLNITVTNTFAYTMESAVIKDRFGAEIEIDDYAPDTPYQAGATQGEWQYKTKGNSDKIFLTWNIGDLPSGETAELSINVSTDLNPAGHQEYTSPSFDEPYELNSGATLKFIDPDQEMQLSAYTGSITVEVPEPI